MWKPEQKDYIDGNVLYMSCIVNSLKMTLLFRYVFMSSLNFDLEQQFC